MENALDSTNPAKTKSSLLSKESLADDVSLLEPEEPKTAEPASLAVDAPANPNPKKRAISLAAPVKDGARTIGEVGIKIDPDGSVSASKAGLAELLSKLIDEPTRGKLDALPGAGGLVALKDLAAAGITLTFDMGAMELKFEAKAEQRTVTEISLQSGASSFGSLDGVEKPADVSGFVNLYGGVDTVWAKPGSEQQTSLHFEADSVFRLWDVVAENDFGFDGDVDTFLCPEGATCVADHRAGLKRKNSRLVYDSPDEQLRFQLGDTTTLGQSFQAQPDFLGLRIEHAPRIFAPGASAGPTGRTSFKLDRPSEIDVLLNGVSVQHLKLGPGKYDLKDLPLQTGANAVQLAIVDDRGEKQSVDFTAFSDSTLLAAGDLEWSAGGGLPSYLRDNERNYVATDWIATANGRCGVTDQVTAELNAQGDSKVLLGGGGLSLGLPIGMLGLEGAVSQSGSGTGFAATASYDLNNVEGFAFGLNGLRESLHLSAEYRSDAFRTPGEFQATASGILKPQYPYSWRLAASYSVPLTETLSTSLSGRYQIGNDDAFKISPLTVAQDHFGLDLSLNTQFDNAMSGGVTLGYGNDGGSLGASTTTTDDPSFRVGMQFTWRPDEKSNVNGSFDSRSRDVAMSGTWNDQKGYEHFDGSAESHRYGENGDAALGASIGYTGNRGDIRVSHSAGLRPLSSLASADQRSSVRVGTAIAFAGDKVAIGAPMRGNAFAIVAPHESIAGKTVTVGDKDDPRVVADGWGPALVGSLPAYGRANVAVDVDELAAGYSLGKGSFDVYAPYHAGYAFEVGSAYSVSAYGTLQDDKGEPIALLTGVATEQKDASKHVAVFTNAAGKFGADGLAPGRWVIEMDSDGPLSRFSLDIPKGTDGLFKAGVLRPLPALAEGKTS